MYLSIFLEKTTNSTLRRMASIESAMNDNLPGQIKSLPPDTNMLFLYGIILTEVNFAEGYYSAPICLIENS